MTPSNTLKLTFIRRHLEKSLEMAGKATKGPWTVRTFNTQYAGSDDFEGHCVVETEGGKDWILDTVDPEEQEESDASFIAAARTDAPLAMEMVIEMIDELSHMSKLVGAQSMKTQWQTRATWLLSQVVKRFESTHGPITNEQVEELKL